MELFYFLKQDCVFAAWNEFGVLTCFNDHRPHLIADINGNDGYATTIFEAGAVPCVCS